MNCFITEQIATHVNIDNQACVEELVNESAVNDLFVNGVASFSNGDIELHEAHDYAKAEHEEYFDLLVCDALAGEMVALVDLRELVKKSALELNELRGNRH